ncbi:CRISPR-associated protein Csx16 [Salinarimonas sp. NSM]|uniref:CRISPR-associated protein Csx16 n=1 Tax=Salinarimonas sp. NSM TaxID=3458003 RepID=UPI0040354F02
MAEGRVLFVGRHPGALAWAARRGIVAEPVAHLDPAEVGPGDRVVGTLPVHVAAAIVARGARYTHLVLDLPADARGRDLDPDEMERFGARLEDFAVVPATTPRTEPDDAAENGRAGRGRLGAGLATLGGVFLLGAAALVTSWFASALEALAGALWPQGLEIPPEAGFGEALGLRAVDLVTPRLDAASGAHAADALLALVFLVITYLGLFVLGRRVLRTRIGVSLASARRARRAVVMALSALPPPSLDRLATTAGARLDAVCAVDDAAPWGRFAWQQNLRALRHHLVGGRTVRVEVLVSRESAPQLDAFAALAGRLAAETGARLEIRQAGAPLDFADYQDVEAAVASAIAQLAKDGFAFGDICIDTTAGTKVVSIASAVITMNKDLEFSYVTEQGRVWLFDARLPIAWRGE